MNIYLSSDELDVQTRIELVRTLEDGRVAIAVAANNVRPAGGGQPADWATLFAATGEASIGHVFKQAGETWLVVDGPCALGLAAGQPIRLAVDPVRRHNLSRAHSLTHLAMAAIRRNVEGYESKGADIGEDTTSLELRFRADTLLDPKRVEAIDREIRSLIARAIPISVERVKSMARAEALFPAWRVDPGLGLTGKIRVIHIEGVDANPCSGSHVRSTAEIGPFAMFDHRLDPDGIYHLNLRRQDTWSYWY